MSLLTQAEEIINRRRFQAENTAQGYYDNALKNPEIAQAENAYRRLLPKISKCEALGIKDEKLFKEFAIISEARKETFSKHGVFEALFLPDYKCKKCGDTGYRKGIACVCLKQEINNIIISEYGTNLSDFKSFEDTDLESNPVFKDSLADKYEKIQKYCCNFPDTKYKTHIFTGFSGTGKTYLASCAAKKVMERGYTVIFLTAFRLNEIFLKYHTDFKGEGASCMDNLYTCDFLVIDDLGTENTFKNVTAEYLLSLFSERFSSGRHTLITTNLDGEQIRLKYDDRIYSRLMDKYRTYIFRFEGKDLRQIKG
jgi:DNA replication protein DnaC